jgi:hypothetical protein
MSVEISVILSADAWSMPDEKTGEIRTGVSFWFLNEYRDQSDLKQIGYKPQKIGGTADLLTKLSKHTMPIQAELSFSSRPGAAGKATLVLSDFKFVASLDAFGLPGQIKKAA